MKERRAELGLTVVDAVEASGVSRSTWRQLESAERGRLTAPVGVKIDTALGWVHGVASSIFDEEPTEIIATYGGNTGLVAEVKRPRLVDDEEEPDDRRRQFRQMLEERRSERVAGDDPARAGYTVLLNSQYEAIIERLSNLEQPRSRSDELLDAWQRLSPADQQTVLQLIRRLSSGS